MFIKFSIMREKGMKMGKATNNAICTSKTNRYFETVSKKTYSYLSCSDHGNHQMYKCRLYNNINNTVL